MSDAVNEPANPEGMLSRVLWQTQHAVEQACDNALATLGMTTTLVGTLAFLAQQPGQSAADLARRARVAPQSTAKAIARLEQLGLLRRESHPVHGRIVQLYLTDAGQAMLSAATSVLAQVEQDLCIGLDDRARARLLDQLHRLRQRAQHLRAASPSD
jgi:DNA-binding MarR family transcriptional regulator